MVQVQAVGGLILAGGRSTRMGDHEKSLLDLGGKPLVAHVIERVIEQVDHTALNANGDPARFARFGLPVLADTVEGFAGPLAGLLAGMEWYKRVHREVTHVLTVAGDTPFFPKTLRKELERSLPKHEKAIALAYSQGQRHPTFGLWPVGLLDDLFQFLAVEGNRKIMLLVERYPLAKVEFSFDQHQFNGLDPFFNVNTPADMDTARQTLEGVGHA